MTRVEFADGLAALDELVAVGFGPVGAEPDSSRAVGLPNRLLAADERRRSGPGIGRSGQRMTLRSRGVTESYDADRVAYGLGSFVRFREAHPTQVPASTMCDPDGFPLGWWFTVRRREGRLGTLDAEVAPDVRDHGRRDRGAAASTDRDHQSGSSTQPSPPTTPMSPGRDAAIPARGADARRP